MIVTFPFFFYDSTSSIFFFLLPLLTDGIDESSPAIVEAVSYLTKKIDSKSRDVRILQPTIATQNVSHESFLCYKQGTCRNRIDLRRLCHQFDKWIAFFGYRPLEVVHICLRENLWRKSPVFILLQYLLNHFV